MITIEVFGLPRPQGSMTLFRAKAGHEVAKYSSTVYEWRGIVTAAARAAWEGAPIEGPVMMTIVFELPRPRSHYGTGRNAGTLRPAAPTYPAVAPDLDKLQRAVLDGLTDAGNVWADDGQVCRIVASKIYVPEGSVPGCTIRVCAATT